MRHYCAKRVITLVSPLFLLLILFTCQVRADLYTGVISGWAESGPVMTIGDGTNGVSLWWSINTYDRGWFYGSDYMSDPFESDVAFATGVTDISQITDASIYSFTSVAIGPRSDADFNPDGIGDFLIWKNISTNHYGAVRLDDIYVPQGGGLLNAKLNATWWFQSDGTGNFNDTVVPVPGAVLLGMLGLGATGIKLRKFA